MRVDTVGYLTVSYNGTLATAPTTFVAAVTTDPATASTGDVRGTIGVPSATDGTKRLTVFVTPSVANLGTNKGLFGVSQV
jgi:hypothetical protein